MPGEPFLEVAGVSKSFAGREVLRGISFTLDSGRTLAIAGSSGGGKSTLARLLAGFDVPDAGDIRLEGRAIATLPRGAVQLIPQQPAASLNPRLTAGEAVGEPLVIRKWGTRDQRRRRVADAMDAVGLDPAACGRPAREFSGGERQRLAIARALAAEPRLLILDEPLASLDLSIQAQVVNLLLDLRRRCGLTYLLISHDLSAVGRMADEIAVMSEGRIVECGPAAELFEQPRHAAARALVEANLALRGLP